VVISGPSGVGKGTICREIVRRWAPACLIISATTRVRTESEEDGKDYIFLTKDVFQERIHQGAFLEYAQVFGNYYGTLKSSVDDALAQGKTALLEIDVQGGKQVKAVYPDAVLIFILPPDSGALQERLRHRGRDDARSTEQRLGGASTEIAAAWQYYEHMVINDDLEQAIEEVMQIIQGNAAG